MTSRSAGLTALLVFSSLACDDSAGFEQIDTVRAPIVGTPASMLRAATTPGVGSSLPSGFALPTDTGEEIAVVARGYEFNGDYLAIDGAARESERSSFILKGDGQNIYGWLVLPERDLAFEYTTSPQGNVIVQRVPITKIYPVCNDGPPEADAPFFEPDTPTAAAAGDPAHVGDYDGSDTNKLQSRPGATKVLFMDVAALTLAKAELWRAWQIVSGAYSAFEVNVTTDAAVYEAAEARNRGKACISNEDGRSTCSVNAFGTSRCCDVYNKGTGMYQGLTTSHELGHLMGLQHDGGGSGGEYFEGLSAFRWVPVMGNMTPKNSWGAQALFQWSKGEYTSATETQDDLAIITKNLPYREDDIPDAKALVVASGGQVSSVDNRGQIARNTDSDTFTFAIGSGGGRATLVVDRIEYFAGAYLDVDAEIRGRERHDDRPEQRQGRSHGEVRRVPARGGVQVDHQGRRRGDAAERVLELFVPRVLRNLGHDHRRRRRRRYGRRGRWRRRRWWPRRDRWDRWWVRGERQRRPWRHQRRGRRGRRRSGGARRHDRRGWKRGRRPWRQHGCRWIERCRGWGTRRYDGERRYDGSGGHDGGRRYGRHGRRRRRRSRRRRRRRRPWNRDGRRGEWWIDRCRRQHDGCGRRRAPAHHRRRVHRAGSWARPRRLRLRHRRQSAELPVGGPGDRPVRPRLPHPSGAATSMIPADMALAGHV